MKIVEFENRVDPDEATPNQMPDLDPPCWHSGPSCSKLTTALVNIVKI